MELLDQKRSCPQAFCMLLRLLLLTDQQNSRVPTSLPHCVLVVQLCLTATAWTVAHQAPVHGFSRQEYWSGLPFFLQGIFPTQELSPGLPHCRQILYRLSHQGSLCLLGQRFCQYYRWKLNYSWPLRSMNVFLIFCGNPCFLKNLSPFSYWSVWIYIYVEFPTYVYLSFCD